MLLLRLGLIGFPLTHSLSPRLHQAALRACDLEGQYELFPIPPEDQRGLERLLNRLRKGELHGLNVTIPHKQNVLPLLDDLTPTARAIGAVNTLFVQEGRLIGENTDAPGFLADLGAFLGPNAPVPRSALVLGAGGSARAVVWALLREDWQVILTARRPEQALALQQAFASPRIHILPWEARTQVVDVTLVVNTTPLGMWPEVAHSPWPLTHPLPLGTLVYDLIYTPAKTRFLAAACRQGLPIRNGLGMLIEQAALSFEVWTGRKPSRQAMWQEVAAASNAPVSPALFS